MNARIAVLDDEPRMAEILCAVLRGAGNDAVAFTDGDTALEALEEESYDVLVTDLRMPGKDGIAILREARTAHPGLPVVLITAHATVQTAIKAMREGAFDYLEKPFDNDDLRAVVRRALDMSRLERENRYLREALRAEFRTDGMVAESDSMQQVLERVRRVARTTSTVLVMGESGTGKELVARALHIHSDRVGGPFVALNCRALSESLLESELFGHEKGAFTGADGRRAGVFEQAHGGTLLLDEIGDIPGPFQAKLLRVLEERSIRRVGGNADVAIDVRIVAASNLDLDAEVAAGRFREDLFYRLSVVPILIEPLRQRRADILPLARRFLAEACAATARPLQGWSGEAEAYLLGHDWPGNVRELSNAIERAAVLADGDLIERHDLEVTSAATPGAHLDSATELREFLDRATAEHIRRTLADAAGVRVDAAERLGIDRVTLYRLMKRLGIEE